MTDSRHYYDDVAAGAVGASSSSSASPTTMSFSSSLLNNHDYDIIEEQFIREQQSNNNDNSSTTIPTMNKNRNNNNNNIITTTTVTTIPESSVAHVGAVVENNDEEEEDGGVKKMMMMTTEEAATTIARINNNDKKEDETLQHRQQQQEQQQQERIHLMDVDHQSSVAAFSQATTTLRDNLSTYKQQATRRGKSRMNTTKSRSSSTGGITTTSGSSSSTPGAAGGDNNNTTAAATSASSQFEHQQGRHPLSPSKEDGSTKHGQGEQRKQQQSSSSPPQPSLRERTEQQQQQQEEKQLSHHPHQHVVHQHLHQQHADFLLHLRRQRARKQLHEAVAAARQQQDRKVTTSNSNNNRPDSSTDVTTAASPRKALADAAAAAAASTASTTEVIGPAPISGGSSSVVEQPTFASTSSSSYTRQVLLQHHHQQQQQFAQQQQQHRLQPPPFFASTRPAVTNNSSSHRYSRTMMPTTRNSTGGLVGSKFVTGSTITTSQKNASSLKSSGGGNVGGSGALDGRTLIQASIVSPLSPSTTTSANTSTNNKSSTNLRQLQQQQQQKEKEKQKRQEQQEAQKPTSSLPHLPDLVATVESPPKVQRRQRPLLGLPVTQKAGTSTTKTTTTTSKTEQSPVVVVTKRTTIGACDVVVDDDDDDDGTEGGGGRDGGNDVSSSCRVTNTDASNNNNEDNDHHHFPAAPHESSQQSSDDDDSDEIRIRAIRSTTSTTTKTTATPATVNITTTGAGGVESSQQPAAVPPPQPAEAVAATVPKTVASTAAAAAAATEATVAEAQDDVPVNTSMTTHNIKTIGTSVESGEEGKEKHLFSVANETRPRQEESTEQGNDDDYDPIENKRSTLNEHDPAGYDIDTQQRHNDIQWEEEATPEQTAFGKMLMFRRQDLSKSRHHRRRGRRHHSLGPSDGVVEDNNNDNADGHHDYEDEDYNSSSSDVLSTASEMGTIVGVPTGLNADGTMGGGGGIMDERLAELDEMEYLDVDEHDDHNDITTTLAASEKEEPTTTAATSAVGEYADGDNEAAARACGGDDDANDNGDNPNGAEPLEVDKDQVNDSGGGQLLSPVPELRTGGRPQQPPPPPPRPPPLISLHVLNPNSCRLAMDSPSSHVASPPLDAKNVTTSTDQSSSHLHLPARDHEDKGKKDDFLSLPILAENESSFTKGDLRQGTEGNAIHKNHHPFGLNEPTEEKKVVDEAILHSTPVNGTNASDGVPRKDDGQNHGEKIDLEASRMLAMAIGRLGGTEDSQRGSFSAPSTPCGNNQDRKEKVAIAGTYLSPNYDVSATSTAPSTMITFASGGVNRSTHRDRRVVGGDSGHQLRSATTQTTRPLPSSSFLLRSPGSAPRSSEKWTANTERLSPRFTSWQREKVVDNCKREKRRESSSINYDKAIPEDEDDVRTTKTTKSRTIHGSNSIKNAFHAFQIARSCFSFDAYDTSMDDDLLDLTYPPQRGADYLVEARDRNVRWLEGEGLVEVDVDEKRLPPSSSTSWFRRSRNNNSNNDRNAQTPLESSVSWDVAAGASSRASAFRPNYPHRGRWQQQRQHGDVGNHQQHPGRRPRPWNHSNFGAERSQNAREIGGDDASNCQSSRKGAPVKGDDSNDETSRRLIIEREDALDILACIVERGVSLKQVELNEKDDASGNPGCETKKAGRKDTIPENEDTNERNKEDYPSIPDITAGVHGLQELVNKEANEGANQNGQIVAALEHLLRSHEYALEMTRASQSASGWLKSVRRPDEEKTTSDRDDKFFEHIPEDIDLISAKAMLKSAKVICNDKAALAERLNEELAQCRAEIGRLRSASHSKPFRSPNRSILDENEEYDEEDDGEVELDQAFGDASPILRNDEEDDASQELGLEVVDEKRHMNLERFQAALDEANETIRRLHLEVSKNGKTAPVVPPPSVSHDVDSPSNKEQRTVNVQMLDAENFVTDWDDLAQPLPPPPDHGLRSPIVAALLDHWTTDSSLQESLLSWMENVIGGGLPESVPPLALSSLDHQVRDGFTMHVLPLLLRRPDIRVGVKTRAHRRTFYDLTVSVESVEPLFSMPQWRDDSISQSDMGIESTTHSASTTHVVNGIRAQGGRSPTKSIPPVQLTDVGVRSSVLSRAPYDEEPDVASSNGQNSGLMGALGGALGGFLSRRTRTPEEILSPNRRPDGESVDYVIDDGNEDDGDLDEDEYNDEQPYHRVVSAPPGRIGVTFVEYRGHAMVSDVSPESPLIGWIFPSDILIAIDELPVNGMRVRDIIKVLKDRMNRQRALRVISSHAMHEFSFSSAATEDVIK